MEFRITERLDLNVPPDADEHMMYGALLALGSAIVAAQNGEATELVSRDGTVAALIIPPPRKLTR